jgi:starch-binding outer membrane protein, SusD/RagB family
MTTITRAMALAALATLAGCDVTNPGPVQDEFLDLAPAHQALVNGAGARFVQAHGYIINHSSFAARELFPTGNCCGNPNQTPLQQAGRLIPEQSATYWQNGHQSRWIAEDAVRRFTALGAGKVNASVFAEAYLWAGYANRLLGENMCDAVFDGGPKEANSKYFERAQAAFTNAINTAPTGNIKTAAYAGRASVRVWLKDWAGAVSDAQQVPLAFVYTAVTDPSNQSTQNNVYWNNANSPYRSYSSYATWHLTYADATGDPRVLIGRNSAIPYGNATLTGYGLVPWTFQQKYSATNSPFRLSTGREMVLVRAEAALTGNDLAGAMTLINSLRTTLISRTTNQPLAAWTAATLADGWTALKRERNIEFWLEARRMGDLRRWDANKTPGTVDWPKFEDVVRADGLNGGSLFKENPPSNCFPIPIEEIDTNPNF